MNFENLGSGWQGRDVSLEIALFEQGFIWRTDPSSWEIVYRKDSGLFARTTFPRSQSVLSAYAWLSEPAEQAKLASYTGDPWSIFLTRETPEILAILAQYYGHENIFGSSPLGFPIDPPVPAEVATVATLARQSAETAGYPSERAYCYFNRDRKPGEWSITDNYDTGITGGSLIYRAQQWFWRRWFSDEPDRAMEGGFAEAQETARRFFTG